MNQATYHTISGYNLIDNYKVHYYFDKYTGAPTNAHVYSDGDSQYSGQIFSYEGGAHSSAALDLFTGDLGTGTFSGGINEFYDSIDITNHEDLFSGEFTFLISAQTTSRQDLGESQKGPVSNNNILFSNLGSGQIISVDLDGEPCTGERYSGWQIGVNAANRIYFESYNNFDPLITTYMGAQPPSPQNIWGIIYNKGGVKVGLYDIATEEFSFNSASIDVYNLTTNTPWKIGSGINFDPDTTFSPQLTLNSGLFAGKVNNFLYFNTGMADDVISTVAKSLYSDLYEKAAETYYSGTGMTLFTVDALDISGLLASGFDCSVTGYETAIIQFEEQTELTGTLTGAMTYYTLLSTRDHAISGVVGTYSSLWATEEAPPVTLQIDEGNWSARESGSYIVINSVVLGDGLPTCWAAGRDVTLVWPASAGIPWMDPVAAEIDHTHDYGFGEIAIEYKFLIDSVWPTGLPPHAYDITVEQSDPCVAPLTGITGFLTINHETGIETAISGCSGTGVSGLIFSSSGFSGGTISGFTGLLTPSVSGLSGQPTSFSRPDALSYIGEPLAYDGVIEKYNVESFGTLNVGKLNNLANIGVASRKPGQGFYIKTSANPDSLSFYLNGVGREQGEITLRTASTSETFTENGIEYARTACGNIIALGTSTTFEIETFFKNYTITSGSCFVSGLEIMEELTFPITNRDILNIYDTGLNTGTVRSRTEVTSTLDYSNTLHINSDNLYLSEFPALGYNLITAQVEVDFEDPCCTMPTCWKSGDYLTLTWPGAAGGPWDAGVTAEIYDIYPCGYVYSSFLGMECKLEDSLGIPPIGPGTGITIERDSCFSEIRGDQWVFFNGQKLTSGINYIDHPTSGFTPSGYITGITGTYFTFPPVEGTTETTGSGLSFGGSPFFPDSNVVFINGVRQDLSTQYVEHSNTKDLLSGKESLKNYGENIYNNYN